ncbi:MAG: hypothetical protein ACRDT8_22565 [Micromonosporaceae bacterium]
MAVDAGEYLLDGGLLWCRRCARVREPAPDGAGARRYACLPGCPVPDTPAVPVEQTATLAALIRAYTVLHRIGRTSTAPSDCAGLLLKDNIQTLPPAPDEVRRWESCSFTDRRAVLRAAYRRLEIDDRGVIHRIWRHQTSQGNSS